MKFYISMKYLILLIIIFRNKSLPPFYRLFRGKIIYDSILMLCVFSLRSILL